MATEEREAGRQDHGGNLREVRTRYGLEAVVDFSASINPLGQPPGLRGHLEGVWDEVLHYPDRDCEEFRAAVEQRHGVPREAVVAGNGSAELIQLALRALCPRRLVLCPPDFSLYETFAPTAARTLEVPRLPDEAFAPDLPRLMATVRAGDAVLFSNPGNPSGHAVPREDLLALLTRVERLGARLILDEAFADFCPEVTLLQAAAQHPSLVVLRSLTKFYGIPGLRLGFLAAEPEFVRRVAELQLPWSVNALAQAAGTHCLRDREWDRVSLARVGALRADLAAALAKLPGVGVLPSAANYLLLRLDPPAPSAAFFYEGAARLGVLVRHCGSFGLGERYLRVAVRTEEENELLLSTLREVLAGPPRPVPTEGAGGR